MRALTEATLNVLRFFKTTNLIGHFPKYRAATLVEAWAGKSQRLLHIRRVD